MAQKRAAQKHTKSGGKGLRVYGIVLGVGLLLSGGAIFAGQADEGFIDVQQVMRNSNNALAEEAANGTVAGESKSAPPRNTRTTVPNGGLVGTGKPEPAPQPEPTPDVNGTSTNATSSDADAGDGSENEDDEDTASSSESGSVE